MANDHFLPSFLQPTPNISRMGLAFSLVTSYLPICFHKTLAPFAPTLIEIRFNLSVQPSSTKLKSTAKLASSISLRKLILGIRHIEIGLLLVILASLCLEKCRMKDLRESRE